MKKGIVIALACLLLFSACGKTGETEGQKTTASGSTASQPSTAKAGSSETTVEAKQPAQSNEEAIAQIQYWYAQTEQNASKLVEEVFGTSACAFWLNEELVKAEYYVVTDVLDGTASGTGYTMTCYYHGAKPYFAQVVGYGKSADLDVIMYFWDGKIIRWFDKDGQHEGSCAEYVQYYDKALKEYDNVQKSHGGGISPAKNSTIGDYQTVQGCFFYIPEGFVIQKEARVSTGLGYEYSFYHAGLDMTIYLHEFYTGGYGISGTEWMEKDYASFAADDTVTYFPRKDSWFVASGYSRDGTRVYYTRVYGVQDFYYRYNINYPTANKSVCDQMVGDFAKSFSYYL